MTEPKQETEVDLLGESFTEFYEKLKGCLEVVCPVHDEFITRKEEEIITNDPVIDKWADWQDEKTQALMDSIKPLIPQETFIAACKEFFRVNYSIYTADKSMWFQECPEGYLRSLIPSEFYPIAPPDVVEHYQQNRRIEQCLQGGPPPNSFRYLMHKLPIKLGSKLTIWGDIHGSAHSICRGIEEYMEPNTWKIKDPKRLFMFLGDYVDRGAYGVEMLYILFRLKITNPNQVFLCRGDHEMPIMQLSQEGFVKEIKKKYQQGWLYFYETLAKLFNLLPCVIFAYIENCTESFLQFCHGGLEMGEVSPFVAQPCSIQFATLQPSDKNVVSLDQESQKRVREIIRKLKMKQVMTELANGFMWNDFSQHNHHVTHVYGRGFVMNENSVRTLLNSYTQQIPATIISVFRGHQHSASGDGLLWEFISEHGLVGFWKRSDKKGNIDVVLQEDGALVYSLLAAPASNLLFSYDSKVEIDFQEKNKWILNHIFNKAPSTFTLDEVEKDPKK